MELSFDYYKNMQDATLYLCNPDRSLLGALYATNRNLTLRFNSLSELTFDVPKYITNANGDMIEHPYFERVATKRLIKVDKVGWFRITEATETENSTGAIKSVIAESHECIFKDMGFVEENRLYKFYDATDPYDETYDADDDGATPSVVGQLYQQLGIRCALNDYDAEPEIDYADWTIVWIEDGLKYRETNEENICRTLKGSDSLFGYDFMITDVGDAFQVLFEFDILHHTIKIKSAATVTQRTNIYLSFDNLIQELAVSEKSDEIVTVLACKGTDLDITSVNPMGTNYICDFSYFMGNEENGYPWMSKALTDKLIEWRSAVQNSENSYANLVEELQRLYTKKAEYDSSKVYIEKKLQDIEEIRDQYINNSAQATTQFTAETVATGEYSREPESVFYKNKAKFDAEYKVHTWYCYAVAPSYDQSANKYSFPSGGVEGTDYITGASLAECFGKSAEFPYFMDGDEKSYCKMKQGTTVDDNGKATYFVDGFDRFVPYLSNGYWYNIYSADETYLQDVIDDVVGDEEGQTGGTINYTLAQMKQIASRTNILSFFDGDEALMRELKCYWVDGNYTNDTLKALEGSTVAENLELAKELMATGKTELNRVCQPRFSFTVTAANFLKMHQFLKFVRELELGKIVTVEKDENTHYYPALTEMTFSLENSEDFSLTFSNSLKLTDWGFTYADLIKSASSTSRAVEANWANLMEYSKNKSEINELLINSLDRTLRAGLENAYNQEFIVDTKGILGRKRRDDGTYENEQLRMTNNLLVFTRDNWQTSSTALGKIVYTTPNGDLAEGYGILTEALIGKLLIGERLWIGNEDGSVEITNGGIVITNGTISSSNYMEPNVDTAPYAVSGIIINLIDDVSKGISPYIKSTNFVLDDNGEAYFKGNGSFDGDITARNLTLDIDAAIGGALHSKNYAIDADGVITGLKINFGDNPYIKSTNFVIDEDGNAYIKGEIDATKGSIGGFDISSTAIITSNDNRYGSYSLTMTTNDETYGAAIKATQNYTGTGLNYTAEALITPGAFVATYLNYKTTINGSQFLMTQPGTSDNTVLRGLFITGEDGLGESYEDEWGGGVVYTSTSTGEYFANRCAFFGIQYCLTSPFFSGIAARIGSNRDTVDDVTGWNKPSTSRLTLIGSRIDCEDKIGNQSSRAPIYASAFETSSDASVKADISNISEQNLAIFDEITPRQFKYNSDSKHWHFGFIAQEIKEAIEKIGEDPQSYGIISYPEEEDDIFSLNYNEFVALCVYEIQKLKQEIKELKGNEA